jgi:hypothetical protein
MIMNGLTADFLENQKYFPDVEERKQEDRSNLAISGRVWFICLYYYESFHGRSASKVI